VRQAFTDLAQDLETFVRNRAAVELQSMSVETPGQARLRCEGRWIGDFLEGDAGSSERRISSPETLRTTKIGHARIHADTGTGGDQEAVGLPDQFGAAW
jgi:hypothetical protein